jgi:hypothetical protein
MTESDFTIEYSRQYRWFSVYEFGVYPHSSVLAGQTMKSFRDKFGTLEEAQEAYPHAEVGFRDPQNFVDHLPDWEMTAYEEERWSDDHPRS